MYRTRRKLLSQNFLRNPKLIKELIRKSSIGQNDTVLEIGPGRGIITTELDKVSKKVIAVELDNNLYRKLQNRLQYLRNSVLVHCNILNYKLPPYSYKVFSNIPFNISADIVRKLTNDDNFQGGYLIVQKEFAQKLVGRPYDNRNQMMSVLLKPWFDISIFHEFERGDFTPIPNVNTTMIRINRLTVPKIKSSYKNLYNNFIIYSYNKRRISRYSYSKVLKQFFSFVESATETQKMDMQNKVRKINNYQTKIKKINRTRKDKNWRKF